MQIQPDYSHQLEEIAKALNRSSIPQWEVALIAALVVAVLGMVGQWRMKVIDNRRDIGKMRRVLYLDLLRIFLRIDDAMNHHSLRCPPPTFWIQQEQLKRDLKFDGETYLKGHQDMQLPERRAAEQLYGLYHGILEHSNSEIVHHQWVVVNMLLYNFFYTHPVRPGRRRNELQRRYIKELLGSVQAQELIKKLDPSCGG